MRAACVVGTYRHIFCPSDEWEFQRDAIWTEPASGFDCMNDTSQSTVGLVVLSIEPEYRQGFLLRCINDIRDPVYFLQVRLRQLITTTTVSDEIPCW